ncbi:hypothetical protein C9374_008703 [Naegleria lovaniensis]|uniref:Myb domain-containing protein n=1 Tax=Naegleria lovaniensis TaxID=51637 RepID=A0AA88GKF1_NAELO|nr:uncharacterized protein C9374_008703 [Naegleria lovaniensis]KAG2378081.1 hypothetical protein C9374_008703 [Naegleria lovaniensis]
MRMNTSNSNDHAYPSSSDHVFQLPCLKNPSDQLTSTTFPCNITTSSQRTLLEPSLSSEILQSTSPHAFSPNCFEIFKLSLNSSPTCKHNEQQPAMKNFAPSTSSSRNSPTPSREVYSNLKMAACIQPFLEAPQEYSVKSILYAASQPKSTMTQSKVYNVSSPPSSIPTTFHTNAYSPHIPSRLMTGVVSKSEAFVATQPTTNNNIAMYNMPYTYSAAQQNHRQAPMDTYARRNTNSSPSESGSIEEDKAYRMKMQLLQRGTTNLSTFDEKSGMLRPNLSKVHKSSSFSKRSTSSPKSDDEDKKKFNTGTWSKYEHDMFLKGLDEVGKNWKIISESYVTTRKRTQIASHAQKYFLKVAQLKKGENLSPDDLYSE